MSAPERTERTWAFSPAGIKARLADWAERRLPVRWVDEINHFAVQTRLIFSRFILLLLGAMFFFFSWTTIAKTTFQETEVFEFLLIQSIGLAIILHMNLWETEREDGTFEFLAMRVPTVHRLIWFKLRVSLVWTSILLLPFFCGFVWFVTISLSRALLYLFFCVTVICLVSIFTCVVASFVHRALPTGIIVAVIVFMLFGFTESAPIPYRDYYRPFLNPFAGYPEDIYKDWTLFEWTRLIVINRLVQIAGAAGFYVWFARRLSKTEKWIV